MTAPVPPAPRFEGSLSALLVEDEERFARLTAEYLRSEGITVTLAHDGPRGLAEALRTKFDVVLLDVMLPGMNGLDVCQRVRARSDVPVIMLTARGEEEDRVLGLESGADDYLVKPFSARELLARIRALVRRARGELRPSSGALRIGALVLDPSSQRASMNGSELALTSYEFALLRVLAERPGKVLSREQLMDMAKGSAEESFDRSVDVHICHLRLKLGDNSRDQKVLRTVRGVGYSLVDPQEPR